MTKEEANKLIAKGYRRTSRKYGLIARIDRPDWKEYMAIKHSPWSLEEGLVWVRCLGKAAPDHYRRCYSTSKMEVGQSSGLKIPCSNWDETEYIP